jgi:hypothetical protein
LANELMSKGRRMRIMIMIISIIVMLEMRSCLAYYAQNIFAL